MNKKTFKKEKVNTSPEVKEVKVSSETTKTTEQQRYEYLLNLYDILQKEGIRSIGDLENKIANIKL